MPAPSPRCPAPRPSTAALLLLIQLMVIWAAPVWAGPERPDALDRMVGPERMQAIRRSLEPDRPPGVQLESLRRRRAPDALRILVVGCDFSDSLMWGRDLVDFPGWPAQSRGPQRIPGTGIGVFDAHDSVYFDLQLERVDDYFRTVSFGAFQLDWTVHPDIYNLGRPMAWYADPDSGEVRLAAMAQEIATAIDATVDFTGFDTLLLVHAGAGSETDIDGNSPAQIPSNYLDQADLQFAFEAGVLAQPAIATAEGDLTHILVLPESETQDPVPAIPGSGFFDVRGVYCFEVGLRLGMLSLADFTPSSFPDSQGIGDFGLMGYGLFTGLGIVPAAPSAINRMLMGWVSAVEVSADADLHIAAMGDPGTALTDTNLIRVPITDREYWLVEYRLQDPDGDLFYGFDDLNGNAFPDYYDVSNAANGGVPDSTFDPLTDTWEDEFGAEVDFFMSENAARPASGCQRGGGSGLYIWHIDEQVIENALRADSNTINGDVEHKGVDVEEADGIQDLDSYFSGVYLLGSDHDAWRGEGQAEFGPQSSPSTRSAGGLDTGIRFSQFSDVVVSAEDPVDGYCTGFVYAQSMRFRVDFGVGAAGPAEAARLRTDGFGPIGDLRVVDLGSGPGLPTADGQLEIVALADSGRVLVLNGGLGGFGPAATLAIASSGDSLRWTGPAAIVDFDGDASLDLLAGSNAGVVAFGLDGLELIDGDSNPATVGPLFDPQGQGASAVVLAGTRASQVVVGTGEFRLVTARPGAGALVTVLRSNPVQNADLTGAITLVDSTTCWAGFNRYDVAQRARFNPLTGAVTEADDPDGFGGARTVQLELAGLGASVIWADASGESFAAPAADLRPDRFGPYMDEMLSAPIAVPTRAGGVDWVIAFTTTGALWALDANLSVLPGFPARIDGDVADGVMPVSPIAVDLSGDDVVELIWCDGGGGLHATDLAGRELEGWPIQGPATPASAPAVGQFDGDPELELVVAGRFEQLRAGTDASPGFSARTVGDLRVYDLQAPVTAYQPWSQGSNGVDNRSAQMLVASTPGGSGMQNESFSVRPNPAIGPSVRLRADALGEVRARLDIYTIEGERVLSDGPFDVPAGTALDIEFDISELGSGTYICQLTTGDAVQRRLLSVVR